MPVRQVVMARWIDGASPQARQAVLDGMLSLRDSIPQVREMKAGFDVGVRPDNFDFVVTADFDSLEDYLAYRDNPLHWQVVNDLARPIMAERAGVVFEH